MVKRIAAIVFVFVMTAVAWAILGSTIFYRTYEADSTLRGRMQSIWGAPHGQWPPTASYEHTVSKRVETVEEAKLVAAAVGDQHQPLHAEQRRRPVLLV